MADWENALVEMVPMMEIRLLNETTVDDVCVMVLLQFVRGGTGFREPVPQ